MRARGPAALPRQFVLGVLVVTGAAGLGTLTALWPAVSVAMAAAFAFLVLVLRISPAFAILTASGAWLGYRLPGSSDALSMADSLLIAGAAVPVLAIDYRRVAFGRIFVGLGLFVASQLPSLAHVTSLGGVAELAHRVFLIVASLLVGAYLGQNHKLTLSLQLFLMAGCGIAAVAVFDALSSLQPAYPLGLQKNYAGDLLACALVIALVTKPEELPLWGLRTVVVAVLASGLAASFSRGGLVAVPVGLLAYTVLTRRLTPRVAVVMVMMLIGAAVVLTQLANLSTAGDVSVNNPQGSLGGRQIYQSQAIAAWQQSPWIGLGVRYYDLPGYAGIDPHNVVLLELAESGVIGLGGFILLFAITSRSLVRSRGHLAKVALSLLIVRLTHGMVDIYWVHGTQSIPWIVVGAALVDVRCGQELARIRPNRRGAAVMA